MGHLLHVAAARNCHTDWLLYRRRIHDDAQDDEINHKLAEENPECPIGREELIAAAFDAYKECRRVPDKFRNLVRPSEP
jgi:hypothetical protein